MTEIEFWKDQLNKKASLTQSQKKIVEYLVNNIEEVAFKTAGELGKEIGVSESSILRLIREFGYDGYNDLKTKVKKNLINRSTVEHVKDSLNSGDNESTINDVLNLSINNLQQSFDQINEEELQKTVELIVNSKNVHVFGMRSSFSAAHYFTLTLKHLLGKGKQLGFYPGCVLEEALEIEEEDLLFVFTHSRYYKNVIDIAKDLSMKNVKIISVTDSIVSPIIPYSDISFVLKTDTWHYISSAVPYYALIDAILTSIIKSENESILERLESLEEFYDKYQVFKGKSERLE